MDTNRADPDTQADVDLLILDYLTCLAIETILSGRISEREGQESQWDAGWILNSVNIIKSILPQDVVLSLSRDISTKLQVLTFASHFLLRYTHRTRDDRPGNLLSLDQHEPRDHGPSAEPDDRTRIHQIQTLAGSFADAPDASRVESALDGNYHSMLRDLNIQPRNASPRTTLLPLSHVVREFIVFCTTAAVQVSETRWFDIAARLTALAVVEEFRLFASVSTEELCNRLSWVPDDRDKAREWVRVRGKYLDYLLLPEGKPPAVHLADISRELSLFQLEGTVIDFLCDTMKSLEPPVLIQLERGKLGDLSRAETQALKNRIGL